MMKQKVLAGMFIAILAFISVVAGRNYDDPVHDGRRLSAWLAPGRQYELRFFAAKGRNPSGRVMVGDLDQVFTPTSGQEERRFTPMHFRFKAVSNITTLVLQGIGERGFGVFVDDVSIVEIRDGERTAN